MRKALLGSVLASGLFLSAAPAYAQFGGGCTQEDLEKATAAYIEAQTKGDPTPMPLGTWVTYNEQMDLGTMSTGVLSKPLKIDFHRTIYDPQQCQTFTEVVVTDPAHPYVLGVTLTVRGGTVNNIDMLATDKGDWLFNAQRTLDYSKAENWDVIPEGQRDSRKTLIAAADAYLDLFNDPKVQVPWGQPCARLEGGIYTAKSSTPGEVSPEDSCNVGVPSGVPMTQRNYVVDEARGAVSVALRMGMNERPDIHTFRVENGKLRYVHTLTVCEEDHCGFNYDEKTKKTLGID
ncbi:MAG TPA: hypothetical protein VFF89_11310 [Sphingobium sp.]|nr:hypothetical protein [Sphingobium sp.]